MITPIMTPIAVIDATAAIVIEDWSIDGWEIMRTAGRWTFGSRIWQQLDWRDRRDRLLRLLQRASATEDVRRLEWLFSGVVLCRTQLVEVSQLRGAHDYMPVLQMVHLDLEARSSASKSGICSRGLFAIIGHEIEAPCDAATRVEQSVLVTRLLAHALREGPIMTGLVKDQHGRMRPLTRQESGEFVANPVLRLDAPPGR